MIFDSRAGISGKNSFFSEFRSGYNPATIWTKVPLCCVPGDVRDCCDDKEKNDGTPTGIFNVKSNVLIHDYPFDDPKV
jgi:hypothetical protein